MPVFRRRLAGLGDRALRSVRAADRVEEDEAKELVVWERIIDDSVSVSADTGIRGFTGEDDGEM